MKNSWVETEVDLVQFTVNKKNPCIYDFPIAQPFKSLLYNYNNSLEGRL